MEIRSYLQIRSRRCLLGLICFFALAACRNGAPYAGHPEGIDYSPYVHENLSMQQALELARKENKMLWTVIGGTESCGYTAAFLQILTKNGFFEKYKDRFVFHTCNPSVPGNEGYLDVLDPKVIPNSYIFHNNGSIVSLYDFRGENPVEFAGIQIESVINGRPVNPMMTDDYSMGGKRLLRHLEKLIGISRKSLSENKDTLLSARDSLLEIDTLSRNYYYYYLVTRVAGKLGDTVLRNVSADAAYRIFARNSPVRWAALNDSIKHYSSVYREDQAASSKLLFEKEIIKYGKIKIGEVHRTSLTVENTGKTPLFIIGTQTSCNCVQVDYPRAPILPGKKETVKIHYRADVKGVFIKTVLFRTNASNKVQKIIVEGQVI